MCSIRDTGVIRTDFFFFTPLRDSLIVVINYYVYSVYILFFFAFIAWTFRRGYPLTLLHFKMRGKIRETGSQGISNGCCTVFEKSNSLNLILPQWFLIRFLLKFQHRLNFILTGTSIYLNAFIFNIYLHVWEIVLLKFF